MLGYSKDDDNDADTDGFFLFRATVVDTVDSGGMDAITRDDDLDDAIATTNFCFVSLMSMDFIICFASLSSPPRILLFLLVLCCCCCCCKATKNFFTSTIDRNLYCSCGVIQYVSDSLLLLLLLFFRGTTIFFQPTGQCTRPISSKDSVGVPVVVLRVLPFSVVSSTLPAIFGTDDEKEAAVDPGGLGNGLDDASYSNDDDGGCCCCFCFCRRGEEEAALLRSSSFMAVLLLLELFCFLFLRSFNLLFWSILDAAAALLRSSPVWFRFTVRTFATVSLRRVTLVARVPVLVLLVVAVALRGSASAILGIE